MKQFLSREDAKTIQGLAVLLIFCCHFLTNYYFSEENRALYNWCSLKVNGLTLELHIQRASQLCRILFAFVSGYAIYVNRDNYRNIKYSLKAACKFLVRYWIILFFFMLAGCWAHEPMPDLKAFIYQMFGGGISNEILCPVFAGYIPFYLILLLFSPVWTRIFQNSIIIEILKALFLHQLFIRCIALWIKNPVLFQGLNSVFATYLGGGALCGYIVAQTDLFSRIRLKNIILLLLLAILAFFVPKSKSQMEEIITAPLFIYSCVMLARHWEKFGRILRCLGRESFAMWIISSIVATPKATFQGIFIWPRQAFLIYANAVIVCFLLSIPITHLQDKLIDILMGKNRLKEKCKKADAISYR